MNLIESFLLLCLLKVVEINCHGRLLDPAARTSAWRFDNRFPAYYDDTAMYCGGFQVQQQNGGKCGICGENYVLPKQFEKGGSMYRGYTVKTYNQGQKIPVVVEITANHNGYFEFMICNVDGMSTDATQNCLNQNYLKDSAGQTKIVIEKGYNGKIYTSLQLPASLSCNHCVFQWRYTAGNNWGIDPITGQGGVGYGPQEQFFGCSDIQILSGNGQQPTATYQTTQSTQNPSTQKPLVTTTKPPLTQQSTQRPVNNGKCTNGDGLYPNLGCKSFYQCVNSGTAFQQIYNFDCPSGLLFNNAIKVCDWPSNVKCDNY